MRIRPWRPSDRELLKAGFYRLSPTSSYRRFLSATPVLTTEMLDELSDVDHHDHEAIVALHEPSGEGVGVVHYVRNPDRRDAAEIALTVIDDEQGLGLGTLLLDAISVRARQEGINTFTALMLTENHRMRRLLEQLGPVRVVDEDGGIVTVAVPIGAVEVGDELRE